MPVTDFRDENQQVRRLARLEPDQNHRLMRAQMTNIQTYRANNNVQPLIPQSDWVVCDNRQTYDSRFIVDQKQNGSCVGFSNACAEMKRHFATSGELLVFSGAFSYALVCGGNDNGAVITDAMVKSLNVGNVLKTQFDIPNLRFTGRPQVLDPQLVASAAQYRAAFCMTVGSWLEIMTAVQMGLIVQLPIQVGSNFENFDQFGACGFANGSGNHSIHVDGAIVLPNNTWALTMMNSWGFWGPLKDGRCLLYQRHIDGAAIPDDAFAHASVMLPNPPTILAA